MLREAWTLAIETLSWMEMRGLSEPLAFAKTVRQLGIDDPDALRFARVLVFETVRRKNFIDAFINEAVRPSRIDQFGLGLQAFLRLFVYSTRFSKDWSKPDLEGAETVVKIVRSILGWKTLLSVEPFLGVLLTQKPSIIFAGKADEARVAFQTFHPKWFVEYCFRLFGRREALMFLESATSALPLYVRLNTLKTSEDKILKQLADDGTEVEKVKHLKSGYRIVRTRRPITKTNSFKEGLIHLQDKSSAFAAEVGNPAPGTIVLDVCSAPGAVTAYLAQLMRNEGKIFSLDYSKRRMAAWRKEVFRSGTKIAEPVIADGSSPLPLNVEADVVVLNPPCTDTGLFSRLPSGKWRLTYRSIARMAELQWKILDNCSEYVKEGGTLIYFTSSVTVEENEMIIERFLKWHPEWLLTEIEPELGSPGLRGLDKCQRLYPHVHQCNGSFIAKLEKNRQIH